MEVIKNLLGSEKAVAVGVLVVGATVLTALGKMSVADWQSYTTNMAMIYVGGKTIQGASAAIADAVKTKKDKE